MHVGMREAKGAGVECILQAFQTAYCLWREGKGGRNAFSRPFKTDFAFAWKKGWEGICCQGTPILERGGKQGGDGDAFSKHPKTLFDCGGKDVNRPSQTLRAGKKQEGGAGGGGNAFPAHSKRICLQGGRKERAFSRCLKTPKGGSRELSRQSKLAGGSMRFPPKFTVAAEGKAGRRGRGCDLGQGSLLKCVFGTCKAHLENRA